MENYRQGDLVIISECYLRDINDRTHYSKEIFKNEKECYFIIVGASDGFFVVFHLLELTLYYVLGTSVQRCMNKAKYVANCG